jgi:hypothetical protein
MVSRSASTFVHPLLTSSTPSLCQTESTRHGRVLRQSRGATTGSSLRLCVKDDLLQTCVLIVTEKRWLYFMLRNVSTLVPVFETGVRLLQGDRRPSTVKSYDQEWLKFEVVTVTSQVQDDAGAPRMSSLSVSSQTVEMRIYKTTNTFTKSHRWTSTQYPRFLPRVTSETCQN